MFIDRAEIEVRSGRGGDDLLAVRRFGAPQTKDLGTTLNKSDADMVVIGTPIDLTRIMKINKANQRKLQEIGQPTLEDFLKKKFGKK